MTLYEALNDFQDLYLARLADSSRRIIDPIETDWQKIDNEYVCCLQAVSEGDDVSAQIHLDNIVAILGGNGIIVTVLPTPPSSSVTSYSFHATSIESYYVIPVTYTGGREKVTNATNDLFTIVRNNGFTFSVDEVTVPVDGWYELTLHGNVLGLAGAGSGHEFYFSVNDVPIKTKSLAILDHTYDSSHEFTIQGQFLLSAGDTIYTYVESYNSANIRITNLDFLVEYKP